ncbi:hypothetical protein KIL84_001215 [Mauremys mutica]|uniref:Uncharacterized protein n=1 Tax=Mauremys mutica TaxID=74926 RepID=A0A9D3X048_9SAUR|nr:hypothetical protein KIL84_001215 [Mauremys mutica]
MLLFALLLLTSALASQRHGAQAESNLSVKLQVSSAKEQNGKARPVSRSVLGKEGWGKRDELQQISVVIEFHTLEATTAKNTVTC